ncbi:MAG TPA: hypothetical protein VIY28_09770, partial [Pseudonocardiaceae bacterium]
MRIPPFRNAIVSISKMVIVQESRISLISGSGARNAGKRPGQRRDGRLDARHDSRELTGCPTTDPNVQLAEPAQLPLHVGQIEIAGLVDAQPDLRHQLRGNVVAGTRAANERDSQFLNNHH